MPLADSEHTILLLQVDSRISTRIWADFDTVTGTINEIVRVYEDQIRSAQTGAAAITYSISDLNKYVDGLKEACCLTYDANDMVYIPHGKDWIKEKILTLLSSNS
jgi:hypothetical protein